MTERRSATSVRLWAFIFVVSLIVVSWFVLLRFSDERDGGPATAAPSLGSYEQTYDLKS